MPALDLHAVAAQWLAHLVSLAARGAPHVALEVAAPVVESLVVALVREGTRGWLDVRELRLGLEGDAVDFRAKTALRLKVGRVPVPVPVDVRLGGIVLDRPAATVRAIVERPLGAVAHARLLRAVPEEVGAWLRVLSQRGAEVAVPLAPWLERAAALEAPFPLLEVTELRAQAGRIRIALDVRQAST